MSEPTKQQIEAGMRALCHAEGRYCIGERCVGECKATLSAHYHMQRDAAVKAVLAAASLEADLAAARKEIGRLRGALAQIVSWDKIGPEPYARVGLGELRLPQDGQFAKIARAALSPPPPTEETTP